MHQERADYTKYFSWKNRVKSLESLLGLIEGAALDGTVDGSELAFVRRWVDDHESLRDTYPYREIIPILDSALADGQLSAEESADITWLCHRLLDADSSGDRVTTDMRRLHGVLGGIVADREITEVELRGLRDWLDDHEHLRCLWPYDEIDALISSVLRDGIVSPEEQQTLFRYFADFVATGDDVVIIAPPYSDESGISGLCAMCPEIDFADRVFTFTGTATVAPRDELVRRISALGASHSPNVTKRTDYLVIGADGNPCWAYACYGRKVEAAVRLRKKGSSLVIVHETDLVDALLDHDG